jgi:hypothetical protein
VNYALRDVMVPLLETFLKIVFSNTSHSHIIMFVWMSGMSANLCPFGAFFNSGKSQRSQVAKSSE